MKWWPLYGLKRKLTEPADYATEIPVHPFPHRRFSRSLFVYTVDAGSGGALNFEIDALESPQYNLHRFGIFMTDSPRHADLLLILGPPRQAMLAPLLETIDQIPRPFGIVIFDDSAPGETPEPEPELPHVLARLRGIPSSREILGLLLKIAQKNKHS